MDTPVVIIVAIIVVVIYFLVRNRSKKTNYNNSFQQQSGNDIGSLEVRAISDPEAAVDLALHYRQNLGHTKMAFKWYLHAAERGQTDAMLMVGTSYLEGVGVELNKELGKKWIFKAEKAGHPKAVQIRLLHNIPSEDVDKLATKILSNDGS